MFPKINPTQTSAWQALKKHHNELKDTKLQTMFATDPERFNRLSLELEDILWDFSKNFINETTLQLFEELFRECGLDEALSAQFNGEFITKRKTGPFCIPHCAIFQSAR